MTKEELIEATLGIHKELQKKLNRSFDLYVSAGGVLLLMGLRDSTEDIDASVSCDIYKLIDVTPTTVSCNGGYIEFKTIETNINGKSIKMDIHIGEFDYVLTEGIKIPTIGELIAERIRIGRDKDLLVVEQLRQMVE